METIVTIVSFLLLIGLVLSPIFIVWRINKLNIRLKFIVYLVVGVVTTTAIALIFGWWSDYSDKMLLDYYGYNFDYMNDTEKLGNVATVNIERVKSLEMSIMGIGWPLKVIITYVFYFPYLLIVYLVSYLFRKKLPK